MVRTDEPGPTGWKVKVPELEPPTKLMGDVTVPTAGVPLVTETAATTPGLSVLYWTSVKRLGLSMAGSTVTVVGPEKLVVLKLPGL